MSTAKPTMKADANETLTSALKSTLERSGALENIRAQVRSTVFECISESKSMSGQESLPEPPIENVLINELIAEYLEFNGYNNSLSVFTAESHTGSGNSLGHRFIRAELGLNLLHRGKTLMYDILAAMKARKKKEADAEGGES